MNTETALSVLTKFVTNKENLERLCSEMLVTLELSIQQGHIRNAKVMTSCIEKWKGDLESFK